MPSIERVYWIYGIPGDTHRGRHSHLNVPGSWSRRPASSTCIAMTGTDRDTVHLDDPSCGLLVGSGVWRELDAFAPGSVCLVLASGP